MSLECNPIYDISIWQPAYKQLTTTYLYMLIRPLKKYNPINILTIRIGQQALLLENCRYTILVAKAHVNLSKS
jgi:hypothetical protein